MPKRPNPIINLAPNIPPWERQPIETTRQFEAFRIFRDMPPHERNIKAVTLTFYQNKPLPQGHIGPPPSEERQFIWSPGRQAFMVDLCWQRKWVYRATLWDAEVDRTRRHAQNRAMNEAATRHASGLRIVSGALMSSATFCLRASQEAIADYQTRIEKAKKGGQPVPIEIIKELQDLTMSTANLLPRLFKAEREALAISADDTPEDAVPEPVVNQAAIEAAKIAESLPADSLAALAADFEAPNQPQPEEPQRSIPPPDEDFDEEASP